VSLVWTPNTYAESLRVVTPNGSVYYFIPGIPQDVPPEHHAYVKGVLAANDGPSVTPNAPVVTWNGTTGAAVWGYKVAAVFPDGDTFLSNQGQVANGGTTANGTTFPIINRPTSMPAGATGWRVVRTQSGGTPAGINVDVSGVLAMATATFNDTGITGTAYATEAMVVEGPADL
jgi:hypothetical protein